MDSSTTTYTTAWAHFGQNNGFTKGILSAMSSRALAACSSQTEIFTRDSLCRDAVRVSAFSLARTLSTQGSGSMESITGKVSSSGNRVPSTTDSTHKDCVRVMECTRTSKASAMLADGRMDSSMGRAHTQMWMDVLSEQCILMELESNDRLLR